MYGHRRNNNILRRKLNPLSKNLKGNTHPLEENTAVLTELYADSLDMWVAVFYGYYDLWQNDSQSQPGTAPRLDSTLKSRKSLDLSLYRVVLHVFCIFLRVERPVHRQQWLTGQATVILHSLKEPMKPSVESVQELCEVQ